MPAPRKYPDEIRERAKRMVAEAREQDPSLSLHAAANRIGPANTPSVMWGPWLGGVGVLVDEAEQLRPVGPRVAEVIGEKAE